MTQQSSADQNNRSRPAKYVGSKVLRAEDPRYLTGRAKYTDDVDVPGALHAAFVRSTHPHAFIRSINTSRALEVEGVFGVYTQTEVETVLDQLVTTLPRPEVKTVTRQVLDSHKVTYVGQPIAVVLATSRYVAEDAAEEVEVDYDPLPPVLDAEAALQPGAPVLRPEIPDNNFAHIEFQRGDIDKAFREADHVFSKRFHQGCYHAAPLELRGVVADYDPASGDLTVWSSSQNPHLFRSLLAGPLGMQESKIRWIADNVGGGFGMKAHFFDEDAIIPALSKLVGRPVKWIEDRYENLVACERSKETIIYLDMAVRADGTFLAFRGRYIGVGGA